MTEYKCTPPTRAQRAWAEVQTWLWRLLCAGLVLGFLFVTIFFPAVIDFVGGAITVAGVVGVLVTLPLLLLRTILRGGK